MSRPYTFEVETKINMGISYTYQWKKGISYTVKVGNLSFSQEINFLRLEVAKLINRSNCVFFMAVVHCLCNLASQLF